MSAEADAGRAETFCPPEKRKYLLAAAILASAMGFIDSSVLSIATQAIRADLHANLTDVQWISNAYLLFLSSLLLIGGAIGDRFGLRNVFAAGIGLFVLASLASALAPNPPLLIAARAIQGLGAAVMVPGSLAIIAKAYPRAERGKAIGTWASASSLTTILGPILGGFLLTYLGDWSWRLVFAINVPLGAGALALLLMQVPEDKPESGRTLDLGGGVLVTIGLFLVAFGLTGDAGNPSTLDRVALYGGVGLLFLLGFLWWETRARAPMLPLGYFRNLGFSGAQGLTFALYFALAAYTFFLPMTLISGWGVTAAEVSLSMLPFGIVLTVLSPIAGRYSDRLGPGVLIGAGAAIVGIGFILVGLTLPFHSLWFGILPINILLGIGMALVVSPLSTAVMTAVEDRATGIASAVNNAVARVAGLVAVALMGGVVALVFAATIGGKAGGPLVFGMPPESPLPAEAEAARQAATDASFAAVAYCNGVLALISAAIAWFTQEKRLGAAASVSPPKPR